jgi:hypothetical protein
VSTLTTVFAQLSAPFSTLIKGGRKIMVPEGRGLEGWTPLVENHLL